MVLLLLSGTALAGDDRAACDAAAHFQVLTADPQPLPEARALWRDRSRLLWPGAPAAARARLQAGELTLILEPDPDPDSPGWRLPPDRADDQALRALHRGPVLLLLDDEQGRTVQRTRVQHAAALDDLYAAAAGDAAPLGVHLAADTSFRLWAPTARSVALCLYADDRSPARALHPLQQDAATGTWSATLPGRLSGQYYTYLVDVWVPGHGQLLQRVTDPYAISLGADSRRAWIGDLDDPALAPRGWARAPRPRPAAAITDLAVYELHLRDFSIGDRRVPAQHRGRYTAFEHAHSHGMRHLRALARAGLTDVHLLPVFDFATVPESGCSTPGVPTDTAADSLQPQAAVTAQAATDCFNWGYDPLHFNAPEGSYASRADDGAVRIREFRRMVMALHRAGLRVGLDVVYNHLSASGQDVHSVLDRIVPGYYHRLDEAGRVATSTCCANSATEHTMMGRLMLDSLRLWARHYRIDSFRFDLMGHQPRALMERARALLRQDRGHEVWLLGEGWNFGEVADGARFVQASQLSLGGSGIATFSDRARDALRGGGHGDDGAALLARKGWLNGADDPALADLVRLGLAGTPRSFVFTTADGRVLRGEQLRYGQQIAGYAQQPGEVVNYVENHDNQTLWDLNAFKLPIGTPAAERARVQVLGLAVTALSQGVAYFHAGVDLLRSKSMDVNSFDSGDHFNRVDWSGRSNHFGSGLPPGPDNEKLHALMAPRLRDPSARPSAADIAFSRRALRDLLALRASTPLLRLRSADQVQQRLRFHLTGPGQNARLIVGDLDGRGLPGWRRLLYLINADEQPQTASVAAAAGLPWQRHPALQHMGPAQVDRARGRFSLPARSVVVFVLR